MKSILFKIFLVITGAVVLVISTIKINDEIVFNFNKDVWHIVDDMETRIETYSDLLYSYRGLFYSQKEVTQDEWIIYNKSLIINERYGKTLEVMYIDAIRDKNLQKKEEIENLSNLDYHYIIKYFYGNSNLEQYVNEDVSSNNLRLELLNKARDTGEVVSSPPLKLLYSEREAVIIYLPVYKAGKKFDTLEEKRTNLEGFVSIIIPVNEIEIKLLSKELINTLRVNIKDKETNSLIYANGNEDDNYTMTKIINFQFADRAWEMRFCTYTFTYLSPSQRILILVIFIFSLLFVLDLSIRTISNRKKRLVD